MKKRNLRPGDIAFDSINYLILIFIGLITLYPFLHVLAISLNDGMDSIKGGIGIVPRVLSVASYRMIFEHPQLLSAAGMSLARTVVQVYHFHDVYHYVGLCAYQALSGGIQVLQYDFCNGNVPWRWANPNVYEL